MRKSLVLFVAVVVPFCAIRAGRADDAADARAIVAKAIKALGGEEKLAKFNAQTFKETGTYYGMGDGLPYTGNYSVQWPHQFRMEIVGVFTIVLNGDKGWMQMNGETREMTADEIKVQQDEHFAGWIMQLTPLKDKQFKLSTVGESKINDRTAVGVRVSVEKRKDVNLYFDKESGLLVKGAHRAFSQEQGKEVNQEIFFNEYKEIEGAKIATKYLVKRDGEKFVEAEAHDIKACEKLDDSVFGKP
jgi:hypothetical protein